MGNTIGPSLGKSIVGALGGGQEALIVAHGERAWFARGNSWFKSLRQALWDSPSLGALPGAAAVMEISEAEPGSCDGAASPVPRHEWRNQRRTAPPRFFRVPCGYGGRSDLGGNPQSEAARTRMGRGRAPSSLTPDKPTPYPRGNAAGGEGGQKWFCVTTQTRPPLTPSKLATAPARRLSSPFPLISLIPKFPSPRLSPATKKAPPNGGALYFWVQAGP